jgi:serine/threonine protein phosphatase PrpC
VSALVGGFTRLGRKRERNEDHVVVAPGNWGGAWCRVAVVCDGIAAGAHGELASAGAARAALDTLLAAAGSDVGDALRRAVAVAHRAVCTADIETIEGRAGPGTTLVAAMARESRLDVAWVGDSRAYLIPPGPQPPELLTHDHSWVNLVVDSGTLTEEDARASRWAQMITKCVGPLEDPDPYRPPEPSLRSLDVAPGSLVVLCSDGFWAEFDGPESLAAAVAEGRAAGRPRDAAALDAGGSTASGSPVGRPLDAAGAAAGSRLEAGAPDAEGATARAGGATAGAAGSIPDAAGSIPDAAGSIPDAAGSIPDAAGSIPDAAGLAAWLVDRACELGADDDVTVAVIVV